MYQNDSYMDVVSYNHANDYVAQPCMMLYCSQIRSEVLKVLNSINPNISDSVYIQAIEDVMALERTIYSVSFSAHANQVITVHGINSFLYIVHRF